MRGRPALDLLMVLWISSALPLILVSATAPLVQRWFAETGHPRAHDPYFLYVASNAGSLIALLSYPIAIEPNLSLADQARIWSAGFVLLGVLLMAGGLVASRSIVRAEFTLLAPSRKGGIYEPRLPSPLTEGGARGGSGCNQLNRAAL